MEKSRRPYALVDVHWLPLSGKLKYPETPAFGMTGYRAEEGVAGMFSVYVETLAGRPGAGNVQPARLYALVDAMRERLPVVGGAFFLTAGATVVAKCVTRDRGEDET